MANATLAVMSDGTLQSNGYYYHLGTYYLSDNSTITLFGPIPAAAFNPGDITYGTRDVGYYQNLAGTYLSPNTLTYDIYDSRTDGVSALYSYLTERWGPTDPDTITNQPIYDDTLEQYINDEYVGGTDVNNLESFGLDPTDIFGSVISDQTQLTELAEAIMLGEGSDNAVAVTIALPANVETDLNGVESGGGEGAQVSLAIAYDVNFSDTLGGTELDLDNNFASQIVDGSLWYTENTYNDTETFSSNISKSYSSSYDPTIDASGTAAWRPTGDTPTTPPVFTLGTIDTDTFVHLGDGTTIYAGSSNNEFTVSAAGDLVSNGDTVALPANFLYPSENGRLPGFWQPCQPLGSVT